METELPIALPVGFTFDDELVAIEEQQKQLAEKKKQLMLKKQLGSPEFQKKLCLDVKDRLLANNRDNTNDINIYKERIIKLEEEIAEYEGKIEKLESVIEENESKIESIEGIDWDDNELDIEDFISENLMDEANEYMDEVNEEKIQRQVIKKSVAKKTAAPKEEGTGRKPAVVIKTMKPADRWALIKVGTQFRAKQKDFIKYYKKTGAGVVECNKQGGLLVGAPVYAGNQEAANAFKVDAGIPYSISGWEFLHIYNPATDKAKSLKKWNGELEYLNW
jgi:hypothetical protein